MENETDEQFEERVLNKRAAQMFVSVRARLQKQDYIQLSDMTYNNNRKQVHIAFIRIDVPKEFRTIFNNSVCLLFRFDYFAGGTKVLLSIGIEEIPGVRYKTRSFVRRYNCVKGHYV